MTRRLASCILTLFLLLQTAGALASPIRACRMAEHAAAVSATSCCCGHEEKQTLRSVLGNTDCCAIRATDDHSAPANHHAAPELFIAGTLPAPPTVFAPRTALLRFAPPQDHTAPRGPPIRVVCLRAPPVFS